MAKSGLGDLPQSNIIFYIGLVNDQK